MLSCTRDDGRELPAEAAAIAIRQHATVDPLVDVHRALQDLKADWIIGTVGETMAGLPGGLALPPPP